MDEYDTIKEQMRQADIDWKRYDFLDNTGMSDTVGIKFWGSGNDEYNNSGAGYMLQRCDSFSGLSVLAGEQGA